MGYLITQILIYLMLAAVIGFLMAWVLRGSRLGQRIEELENELWSLRHGAGGTRLPAGPDPGPGRELEEARAECARLRQELEQAQARQAAAPAPSAPPPADLDRVTATAAPARAVRKTKTVAREGAAKDAGRAPIPAARSDNPDDLTRIKGIGPKIEGILHTLGVHHFHQIAGWSPDNVEWVNDHLRFKGRIQREQWIEQAKKLSS